jgi:HlyD family type I secretion membrane fusion protein
MKQATSVTNGMRTLGFEGLAAPLRGPALYGIVVIVGFFGVFGGWAALAPLDSAAIAPGVVTVTSSRRQIQHLEGGIVTRILAREGDTVTAGDPLVVLSSTQSGAALSVLENRMLVAKARRDRLVAERDGVKAIRFSKELIQDQSKDTRDVLDGEQGIFEVRLQNREVERAISQRRGDQLRSLITGIKAQNVALAKQAALIRREHESVAKLVAKGLERQPRALALEREKAEIERDVAGNSAEIARTRLRIDEIALQDSYAQTSFLNGVMDALTEAEREIADLQERGLVAGDVLARTTVVAPVDGIIVDLRLTTIGGVVRPGEIMLDLLPTDDKLIVEARVAPDDIDVVETGLPAQVNITALNQRTTAPYLVD